MRAKSLVVASALFAAASGVALAQTTPPPTREATETFVTRHLMEHGRLGCEHGSESEEGPGSFNSEVVQAGLDGPCVITTTMHYRRWFQGDPATEVTEPQRASYVGEVVSIVVGDAWRPPQCGAGVNVSVTFRDTRSASHGTTPTSSIQYPMDSRAQADRLVHALQHLSSLCYVAAAPDPF